MPDDDSRTTRTVRAQYESLPYPPRDPAEEPARLIRTYLDHLARAIQDGADVRGYFYWTLIDNFEWQSGFGHRMGLVHVNHKTQTRTVRASGYWYRDYIAEQQRRWRDKE